VPLPKWLNRTPPPHLAGEFAQAAYHGAIAVASRLTHDPGFAARALLTDLYISSAHDLPYTVGDAAAVTRLEFAAVVRLVTDLAGDGALRVYKRTSDGMASHHRIGLTSAKRAELSGYFARELMTISQADPVSSGAISAGPPYPAACRSG
jgi:hypothetical protein